jgi:hypothetical protein
MTPLVSCLREDQTVGEAAEFFLRWRTNSTPVVDVSGNLVGIVAEKDLLATIVSLDCWNRPVREVMKPNVTCYEEDVPLRTIYKFICRVSIRRVVIVRGGRPVGTISRGTLLRWFTDLATSGKLPEGQPTPKSGNGPDPRRSKEQLAETAHQLVHRASELHRRLQEDAGDLMSHVAGGASGMQQLVEDLLAYSHPASASCGPAAETQPVRLDEICAE